LTVLPGATRSYSVCNVVQPYSASSAQTVPRLFNATQE
jgi:hypothetical protein